MAFRRAAAGLRALLRKARVEQELDAELHDFLDTAVEQKMRAGMAVTRRRARRGSSSAVRRR